MHRAATSFADFGAYAGTDRRASLARLEALSVLLDSALAIPGTRIRLGADAALGLVPGVGDAVSAALSLYIVWEARRLGLPRTKLARMLGNVALDGIVGAIPVIGDIFDVAFKSNRRNLRILREHLGGEISLRPGDYRFRG
jgi:hypothetical protein